MDWRVATTCVANSRKGGRRFRAARRGLILPVMLVILLLLALLVASFAFQVQADYSAGVMPDTCTCAAPSSNAGQS